MIANSVRKLTLQAHQQTVQDHFQVLKKGLHQFKRQGLVKTTSTNQPTNTPNKGPIPLPHTILRSPTATNKSHHQTIPNALNTGIKTHKVLTLLSVFTMP